MNIDYDPDNIDCLIKELLYFLDCSIVLVDGKYYIKEDNSYIYDCDSYFGVLKFLLNYAYCNFDSIMYYHGGVKNDKK